MSKKQGNAIKPLSNLHQTYRAWSARMVIAACSREQRRFVQLVVCFVVAKDTAIDYYSCIFVFTTAHPEQTCLERQMTQHIAKMNKFPATTAKT
jgi:hypothetical protein